MLQLLCCLFLCLFGILVYLKVYPFGDGTYIPVDAFPQYSSYLSYFKEIFFEGNSIFYSLGKSIGGEMYGLFAYYLASPFNLITLFFSKDKIALAFDIILIIKTSATSLSFFYFLNKKSRIKISNLIFALAYSLSAYSITYGFNIMWLDALILLPLVITGIDRLISEDKIMLYIISLSITLITNYYMGFMVCVFALMYFMYKLIIR
ncbi:MAG: YfhO family protein [Clostridia bacterium]|jgi:uncharacterized membrane protein YfhO|nr:YfhO family protein [Clostridia bacterium]